MEKRVKTHCNPTFYFPPFFLSVTLSPAATLFFFLNVSRPTRASGPALVAQCQVVATESLL